MADTRYILLDVDTGFVENIIEWDGIEPLSYPENIEILEAIGSIGKGWQLVDGDWHAPLPIEEEEPS